MAGCKGFPGNAPPTFIPEEHLPTVIELTAQAMVDEGLVTPPPPATIDPEKITPTPDPSETPTETLEPRETTTPTIDVILGSPEPLTLPEPLPQAEIQIINPGRLSRVKSPINLHIYLAPPTNEKDVNLRYQVSLYGDDGSLLVRHEFTRDEVSKESSHLLMAINFEITSTAETSRLEIRSLDEYGRVSALTSTELILLKDGDPEIKQILDLLDNLIIQQPIPSTLIQGDLLIIQGFTRYAPADKLLVEIIDRDGSLVGSAEITVSQENLGIGYRPFAGEIPFQVGKSSWVRVQVIARDDKFSGILYLSSVEVLVSP